MYIRLHTVEILLKRVGMLYMLVSCIQSPADRWSASIFMALLRIQLTLELQKIMSLQLLKIKKLKYISINIYTRVILPIFKIIIFLNSTFQRLIFLNSTFQQLIILNSTFQQLIE